MTTLQAGMDDVRTLAKKHDTDIHVTRTELKQRADNMHTDLKTFHGQTNANFRGLNVLVPQSKHLHDANRDMLDYLSRNHQHNEAELGMVKTTMESANNCEDRIVRVESLCTGLTDQANDHADISQQINEAVQIMMEHVQAILERTPKLPKRSPPAEQGPHSQNAASSSAPAMPTTPPPVDPQPIRISEHIQQPMPSMQSMMRDRGDIYMVRDPAVTQMTQMSTRDLLQVLLSRGGF